MTNEEIKKIQEFKGIFFKAKNKVDKIKKETGAKKLYSEKEFYDHFVYMCEEIDNGRDFESLLKKDLYETQDEDTNYYVDFECIDHIIKAITENLYYELEEDEQLLILDGQQSPIIIEMLGYNPQTKIEYNN